MVACRRTHLRIRLAQSQMRDLYETGLCKTGLYKTKEKKKQKKEDGLKISAK